MAKRRHPERDIQAQIVRLLKSLGADVWVLGTTRRRGDYQGTMMSPGIPDLYVMLPYNRDPSGYQPELWIEVKAPKGRMSAAQKHFEERCNHYGVQHIVGGLDEVLHWLVRNGYLASDAVFHERRNAT